MTSKKRQIVRELQVISMPIVGAIGRSPLLLSIYCIAGGCLSLLFVSGSIAQQKDKFTYPVEVIKTFMKGCQIRGSKGYCSCIIDELQTKYSFEEFVKIDNEARENRKVPGEVETIFNSCSKK